jgi:hypothetical protein
MEGMKMKYKVGDKVLIKENLTGDAYGITAAMREMSGKTGTIREVANPGERNHCYKIDGVDYFQDSMIERRIDMTKDDLKVGYVVEQRDGVLRMVMPHERELLFAKGDARIGLSNYNDDLTCIRISCFDIVRVYGYTTRESKTLLVEKENRPLLWERKEEPIEITIEEIAKLKGVSADRIRIKDRP